MPDKGLRLRREPEMGVLQGLVQFLGQGQEDSTLKTPNKIYGKVLELKPEGNTNAYWDIALFFNKESGRRRSSA